MASTRREIRRVRAASRRVSAIELSVTVCVLIGLLFVSFRLIGGPPHVAGAAATTQTSGHAGLL
jgi:hypothetical protein